MRQWQDLKSYFWHSDFVHSVWSVQGNFIELQQMVPGFADFHFSRDQLNNVLFQMPDGRRYAML
jgi:hypothetical protein